MHFISFSKKGSIYEESQPFSSGWKCCPQAAIVTWNKDASLLWKRPRGHFFIHIFIFFMMYTQISIVKKSCVIPQGCAFNEKKVCSGLRLNCSLLGKRGGILTEKHFSYRKDLERVRSQFFLYSFLLISFPFRFLFPSNLLPLSFKISLFSASFLILSNIIFLHTAQNFHPHPPFNSIVND